ncbi:MAG: SusC/RagA family TonB-linked outer membrane protein, partial [Cyclobacteriaceae bacterium]|nr:SusC/RagA family TonB-linked outer membrane protein [Cyclobacteriaceae bacterium]
MSKLLLYGSFIQCLLLNFLVAAPTEAQKFKTVREVKVKLDLEEASLMEVFSAIESNTDFKFSYYKGVFDPNATINLNKSHKTVRDILLQISREKGLSFKQINNNIKVQKLSSDTPGKPEIEVIIQGV